VRQILYWPLKRRLFDETFKVIARVGLAGSDETVLEPDDIKSTNDLDVTIKPKREGELFLYVNDAVWAFDKGKRANFYEKNQGTAKIEVTFVPK
jgi:hypothetical protein